MAMASSLSPVNILIYCDKLFFQGMHALGYRKWITVAAMQDDIGCSVPAHRQWPLVIRQWCRLAQMDPGRINKRVFNWALTKTALFHTIIFYQEHHMYHICNINNDLVFQYMKEDINVLLTEYYDNQWSLKINRICHSCLWQK